MKYLVVLGAVVVAVASAQLRPFRSPSLYRHQRTSAPAPAPARLVARAAEAGDLGEGVLRLVNDVNPDGSFAYDFELANGIAAKAKGTLRTVGEETPVVFEGSYSFTSPEGVPVAITYVADENGYQPQGDAIPTAPPVPPQIARALEYIAKNAPKNADTQIKGSRSGQALLG